MSADNVLGGEIVLKISYLPSKLRFSAKYSFFGQSLSHGHYQPTYQPPEGVYLLNISSLIFFCSQFLFDLHVPRAKRALKLEFSLLSNNLSFMILAHLPSFQDILSSTCLVLFLRITSMLVR